VTEQAPNFGMIGLGRMGANIVKRLARQNINSVVYDVNSKSVSDLAVSDPSHITGANSIDELISKLATPRTIWVMVPAGDITNSVIDQLLTKLSNADTIIDGGNSYYRDDILHAKAAASSGINFLDVGTSGGVWGLERGYCLMIGGNEKTVNELTSIWDALAPGFESAPRTIGNSGEISSAERGWLHCGPAGAGHFVKMIHNGIEYGLMAAYAEGFNILKNANIGTASRSADAETAPLTDPSAYQYDFDLASIAEVWRRGSVVSSWLLDLTAQALSESPELNEYSGRVSDSGEGRWTAIAAIEEGVPAPVLSSAVFTRFESRSGGEFANKILSAMRKQFGGHIEKRD
jgi:6-phosphogluconate dehydrogenase